MRGQGTAAVTSLLAKVQCYVADQPWHSEPDTVVCLVVSCFEGTYIRVVCLADVDNCSQLQHS